MVVGQKFLDQLVDSRWIAGGSRIDFRFESVVEEVEPATASNLPNCDIEPEWERLHIFGVSDEYGGAYDHVCIDETTRKVVLLDSSLEPPDSVADLNSTTDAFVQCFSYLNGILNESASNELPLDAITILQELDPDLPENSSWIGLCIHVFEQSQEEAS